MRKDILAAGARKASYLTTGKVDDEIELRNVAPEGTRNEDLPETTLPIAPRKKFIPTEGVLLVRRNEALSPSGLLDTSKMEKEQPAEGVVLETGFGSSFKVGSHIVFGKYSGAEFRLNGEDLLLMEEIEVKGFIVEEPQETTVAYIPPFIGLGRA